MLTFEFDVCVRTKSLNLQKKKQNASVGVSGIPKGRFGKP